MLMELGCIILKLELSLELKLLYLNKSPFIRCQNPDEWALLFYYLPIIKRNENPR